MRVLGTIFEYTIFALLIIWVIVNGTAFGSVANSVSSAVTGSIRTFWKQ